jgi:hypothetical protein
LPTRRGPKPKYKEMPLADDSLEAKVLSYRQLGYNKFVISESIKKLTDLKRGCSASSIYRILRRYGESKLRRSMVEIKRKIIREYSGSLGHIDCHTLPKGVVKSEPNKRYYSEAFIILVCVTRSRM